MQRARDVLRSSWLSGLRIIPLPRSVGLLMPITAWGETISLTRSSPHPSLNREPWDAGLLADWLAR